MHQTQGYLIHVSTSPIEQLLFILVKDLYRP